MLNAYSFTVMDPHKVVTKIILGIIDHITLNTSKTVMTVKEDALGMKLLLNYSTPKRRPKRLLTILVVCIMRVLYPLISWSSHPS